MGYLGFVIVWVATACLQAGEQEVWRLDFGPGSVESGFTQVLPDDHYSEEKGFGFWEAGAYRSVDGNGGDALRSDAVTSDAPFYFMVDVPEGNYRVTVTLGDRDRATETTVKAELRRLMLQAIETEAGQFRREQFTVNVRRPQFSGAAVRLKDREQRQEAWAWDKQLTLEFNGPRTTLCAMEIEKVDAIPTVFILGDSTVCDQSRAPWNSWGQMLPRFFRPSVVIANHAESGESIRSSLGARRFDKVYSQMKPGDYLLLQFGHNDMKDRAPDASDTYKANLKAIVKRVRDLGGTPILITSMERKAGIERDTLRDYPAKVREVAAEDSVALIDLHEMSKVMYRALGDHLDGAFQDGTHHTNYGSYLFAECVTQGIRDTKSELARHIVADFSGFDPGRPDPRESVRIPVSPLVTNVKPLGD